MSQVTPRADGVLTEPDLEDSIPEAKMGSITDGSFAAWANLIGGFASATATFGYTNAFGVYQDIYTRSHIQSASNISWIGSTQLCLLLAIALPAGKLLDMGYFRPTLLVGSLLFTFSLFMVSVAKSYWQIYLCQGIGMGIGAGLIYVPAVAVQAHYWQKNRALAMGCVTLGSSTGGLIFPIMLNQLFKSSAGFAWGVRASAFVVLGLLTIANLTMSSRTAAIAVNKPKPDMKGILSDVPYLLANFGTLIFDWGLFFPYFYLQLFSVLHGVNSTVAFYTLATMNAASFPGRILPNILADKFGPFNVAIPASLACSVLLFALLGIDTTTSVIIFAILFGFFSGAFLSLAGPVIASMARDNSEVGVRFGLAYFITAFGALSGPPVVGALLGQTFPWWRAIVFAGVACLIGTLSFVVARMLIAKWKSSAFV